jgi:hypothetical protein
MQADRFNAIEQVFVKGSRIDYFLEIDTCRTDDSYASAPLFVTAKAREGAILQESKQLYLHLPIHVADLIEEEGASVRNFNQSCPIRAGSFVGSSFSPKEFTFEQPGRGCSAVQLDERCTVPVGATVQKTANYFLACSALAQNKHRKIAGKNTIDLASDLAHGRSAAKNDGFIR